MSDRNHALTLADLARMIRVACNRLPAAQEVFKVQRSAALLERHLEELVEALR